MRKQIVKHQEKARSRYYILMGMLFFFYGENTFAAAQKIKELQQRFIKTTGSDFGLHKFNEESDPDKVAQAMTTVPMFSESSLVVIEHPSRNRDLNERILSVLGGMADRTVVVIHDPEADKRTVWFKTLQKHARVKEFGFKNERQLTQWINQRAAETGASFSPAAVSLLIEYIGDDEWRLSNEIQKLAVATGKVNEETVETLVQPAPRQTVFELLDALAAGNIEQALSHLHSLSVQKVHELEILAMLAWQLRVFLIIAGSDGIPDRQIIKDHKLNPYVLRKSKAAARRVPVDTLVSAYQDIIDTDYAIKTLQTEPDLLLEQLVIKLYEYLRP